MLTWLTRRQGDKSEEIRDRVQLRTGDGRAPTVRRERSKNSEPKAARQSPADKPTAPIPTRSSSKPNSNGDAACSIRACVDSNPLRTPYPWGPNNANGKVPLLIVIMPLPAPVAAGLPVYRRELGLPAPGMDRSRHRWTADVGAARRMRSKRAAADRGCNRRQRQQGFDRPPSAPWLFDDRDDPVGGLQIRTLGRYRTDAAGARCRR